MRKIALALFKENKTKSAITLSPSYIRMNDNEITTIDLALK
jgi:hypothetical protein